MTASDASVFEGVDFLNDDTVTIDDPYPYYEFLRDKGPVTWDPHNEGVAIVTGLPEAHEVYRNHQVFSACNASTGPFYGISPRPGDGDINELIECRREESSLDFMSFSDPPVHERYRKLMSRLFTPRRLRENEEFMWRLADVQLDKIVSKGECEFIHEFTQPFTVLIIADLLGVPDDDREKLLKILSEVPPTGAIGDDIDPDAKASTALMMPVDTFIEYIEDRRREPRGDVLTHLALAKFPDGSTPDATKIAREAAFMFVAGGETTTRSLGFALRYLAEHPGYQTHLREHRELIPNFVEETLRMEAPVKGHFRLTRRPTTLGGVDLPAGTTVMLLIAAANRDPRRFSDAQEFCPDRANAVDHITFGRGVHSCIGQSLARAESRISLERILDRMADIKLSEKAHGPTGAHRFQFDPTYIFRGMQALHLEYTPV